MNNQTFLGQNVLLGLIAALVPVTAGEFPLEAITRAHTNGTVSRTGNGSSLSAAWLPGGNEALFVSQAGDLTADGTTGEFYELYLRNLTNQQTRLLTRGLSGLDRPHGSTYSGMPTADGRFVLFVSEADDLVALDTNTAEDVFLYDLTEDRTQLISVNAADSGSGNGASAEATASGTGQIVAFVSLASDLVADDTNGLPDVFVRDLAAARTDRVTGGATGQVEWQMGPSDLSITPDGRWIAFTAASTNFAPGVTNLSTGVFLYDRQTTTLTLASQDVAAVAEAAGMSTNWSRWIQCYGPVLSDDGSALVFKAYPGLLLRLNPLSGDLTLLSTNVTTSAGALTDEDGPVMTPDGWRIAWVGVRATNAVADLLVWDATTGLTQLANVNPLGERDVTGDYTRPQLTPNGRFLAFASDASGLVDDATNSTWQIYVRDLEAGTTQLASRRPDGTPTSDAQYAYPLLSDDGRQTMFESIDAQLTPPDLNQAYDVFVRDLELATNLLLSVRYPAPPGHTAAGFSSVAPDCWSDDGRWLVFTSGAPDLLPTDVNTTRDVFVRDLATGVTQLVSGGPEGHSSGDIATSLPVLSGNGRYVAFSSGSPLLLTGDTNSFEDVFVRDLQTGTLTLVSHAVGSASGGNGDSTLPQISTDGATLLFETRAKDLRDGVQSTSFVDALLARPPGATPELVYADVLPFTPVQSRLSPNGRYLASRGRVTSLFYFIWDRQTGLSTQYGLRDISELAFSPDSSLLALAYIGSDRRLHLRWHLLETGAIEDLTLGATSPYVYLQDSLVLSGDGRFIALALKANATATLYQAYLFDRVTRTLALVSANRDGQPANGRSDHLSLSRDGRHLAFQSTATDLVEQDDNQATDVFLFDRLTGSLHLVTASRLINGTADYFSGGPVLSPAGDLLAFRSAASDLVPNDSNGNQDVFLARLPAGPVDADGDDLPDAWESATFNTLSRDGSADADGDGRSDREEFLAGSGATDPLSRFALSAQVSAPGTVQLSWPGRPGARYQIEARTSLAEPWQPVAGVITEVRPGEATAILTNAPTDTQRFLRVTAVP